MSLYPYRLLVMLVAILLTFMLGYVADLRIINNDEADLQQSERALQAQLQQLAGHVPSVERLSSDTKSQLLLHHFLQLIHENNVDLLSITKMEIDGMSDSTVYNYQLILAADYQPFMRLMQQVSQQSSQYFMSRFVISMSDKKQLRVELLLSMRQSGKPDNIAVALSKSIPPNPFCNVSDVMLMRQSEQHPEINLALKDMRLIGVTNHDGLGAAIILFPNGRVMESKLGNVLGKEGGTVVSIQSDAVKVLLPNQRHFTLHHVMPLQ